MDLPTPHEDLERFFDWFWADTEAWVYTPISRRTGPTTPVEWLPLMFQWPAARQNVISHLLTNNAKPDVNCYFSPALFSRPSPKQDAFLGSRTLWCDYDGNAPAAWPVTAPNGSVVPPPQMRVESSGPGHEHVYWGLDTLVTDAQWVDDKNRALAYATGADTSGWDRNQVLRPPHTMNRKYDPPRAVRIAYWDAE